MDKNRNPFSPGAGTQPPELAGRDAILEQAMLTLGRVKQGRNEKSMLLVGLRGTGKTVLLRKIYTLAKEENYQTTWLEISEQKSLLKALLPELRRVLFDLDNGEISTKVKRAFRVLKSFVSNIKLSAKIGDIDVGLSIEPERGTADSGDLEADLVQVFLALGEAAKDKQTAIAVIIDELQYLNEEELSSLIMAAHRIAQESLPVVVFGAGLPQLVGKAGRAKSYSERLFDYPEIGPLEKKYAISALQNPVQKEGVSFTKEALNEIIRVTEGYPYFLQEWGYQAWNLAQSPKIDLNIAQQATNASIQRLDRDFFRVRFDRLTPAEKKYLRALAELGHKSQRSSDVAEKLGIDVQKAAPFRNNLIKKGMIYSPNHGDTAFTVPLFDDFLKRTIPSPFSSK
ncbi:MAG: AAA family ATPase [Gammaproteobacteria bacterium GWE2_37_16]|nr:MAG: AAA family ATPase [Gammaproteobacteria bacterium GWE2_37_16]